MPVSRLEPSDNLVPNDKRTGQNCASLSEVEGCFPEPVTAVPTV